jgi:alpha-N-acetylglucosaminidase
MGSWLSWLVLALAAATSPATPPPNGGPAAAAALAVRVLGPAGAAKFSFSTAPASACPSAGAGGGPCVVIATGQTPGTIKISGSTPVEMARGLAHYCRTVLRFSFAWEKTGGVQALAAVPSSLPPLAAPITLQKQCAPGQANCYSYYMNVCTETYSSWNWDWARWEKEVDWMALSGINLVLAYTGREYVYRKVYQQLGLNLTSVELAHGGIEAGPAFLAFSRTENWANYDHSTPLGPGHPNWGLPDTGGRTGGPLPDSFVLDQWHLGKRIVARQMELGIGSILPAFQGNVPRDLAARYPSANISVSKPGEKVAAGGVGWLDGLDPLFAKISRMVLQTLVADFGATGFYEADGFFDQSSAPWLSASSASSPHSPSATAAQQKTQMQTQMQMQMRAGAKTHLLRHFILNRSFYHDRLGASIGKALRKRWVFLQALAMPAQSAPVWL